MSNINKNEKVILNKHDVNKSYWIWQFYSHANYNYERLQASAFAASMVPIAKKLYPNDRNKQSEVIKRHLSFFNTEPNFGTVIHGIVIAMEEQIANGAEISTNAINSIKTGLMGPLAGIGDTLTQGTIIPLLLAIGIQLGKEGNIFGPLFFILTCSVALIVIARTSWFLGYNQGREAVSELLGSEKFDTIVRSAGILGAIVIGALIAQFVNFNLLINFNIGDTALNVQADIFDKIIPNILPFGFTLLMYKLLEKGKNPIILMFAIIVGSIIASFVGIV